MRRVHWAVGLMLAALANACSWSQTQVSLRERIQAQFMNLDGNSGVEFTLGTRTYVVFGQDYGYVFYRYTAGDASSIQPVGTMRPNLNARAYDLDEAVGTSASRRMIVGTHGGVVVLFELEESGNLVGVRPYGVISGIGDAQRVQIEALGTNRYLIVVGLASGELVAYDWTAPASPASAPEAGLSLTPAARLRVDSGGGFEWRFHRFENGVRALRMWQSGGVVYVAAGGRDGVVWFGRWTGSSLAAIGKAQLHPAPIAELSVVGSRLAVALETGLVYVYGWSSNSLGYQYTLKEPYAPLGMHSLCALSGDRLAVATAYVRVYNLANGAQVADWGGSVDNGYRNIVYLNYWYRMPAVWVQYPNVYYPVRLLPAVSSSSYFVKMGWGSVPRTDFMTQSGSFSASLRSAPAYALAYGNGQLAEGRADGVVQWGASTQNVGEPVFVLKAFQDASGNWWLLGSYGAGKVFAWRAGQPLVGNIMPAGDARIVYGLDVVSASATEVRFMTASGDGQVELWSWGYTGTAARVGSALRASWPLHTLSVNANRTLAAVGSFARWDRAVDQPRAWRLSVGAAGLSNLQALEGVHRVDNRSESYPWMAAFHPTDPNRLAVSAPYVVAVRYLNADATLNRDVIVSASEQYEWYYTCPTSILWLDSDRFVAASLFQGIAMVYTTSPDTVIQSRPVMGDSHPGRYGVHDRSLLNVYEPHRDRIYVLISPVVGELASCAADRRVVRWSVNLPVASSWSSGRLWSLDFSPYVAGQYLLRSCYMYSPTRHALLYYVHDYCNLLAVRVPSGGVRVRAIAPGFVYDITDNDVTVSRYIDQGDGWYWGGQPYYGRVEVSEDGAWVLTQINDLKQGTTLQARFYITPHTGLNTVQTAQSVSFNTTWTGGDREYSAGSATHTTLSPSGSRIAVCAIGSTGIRIYDRSGSSWNFGSPNSVINVSVPADYRLWLKFVADDVLLVWYHDSSANRQKVEVYQFSGGSWLLRQTLDNVPMLSIDKRRNVLIDAIPVGSSARVALLTSEGLRFYRLDRSGGVATLTEVGRAERAANGFMNVGYCGWIRFSRQNPNLLSTADWYGRHAVVYDLTGLFSW